MKEKLVQLEGYLGGEKEEVLWGFKHTYVTKDSQLLFNSHMIPLMGLKKVLYYQQHGRTLYHGHGPLVLDLWLIFCYEDGKRISITDYKIISQDKDKFLNYGVLKAAISNEERDVTVEKDTDMARTISRTFSQLFTE